jgi:5'-nucleotidase
MTQPQILLTNDDGIQSPGLWAAAEALSALGFVHVVAPRQQWSGAGRSLPPSSDGAIHPQSLRIQGKEWTVYAVGGTPAQAVLHGLLEIMPTPPALVVSGINYGENPSEGITASGTVGAALEAASNGFPALAISLETDPAHYLSHSSEVDFSTAAHFTRFFGHLLLSKRMPFDVDVLKVEIPSDATPATPWQMTRLSRQRYFLSYKPNRTTWEQPIQFPYSRREDFSQDFPNSDATVLRVHRKVAVTPLSLDITSRVPLDQLDALLRSGT